MCAVDKVWRKHYFQEVKKGGNIEQLLRKARGNTDKLNSLLDDGRGHLRSMCRLKFDVATLTENPFLFNRLSFAQRPARLCQIETV